MDLDILQGIAAFGGLALGVVNLALYLYKDFFRSAKLTASVTFAGIRSVAVDTFDLQIDVCLVSKGGTVYLNRVSFDNDTPIFDPINDVGTRDVYKVIGKVGYDILLADSKENFKAKLNSLFNESLYVANMRIDDKEHKVITIIDRIVVKPHMDGPWQWPLQGWKLIFHSSAEDVKVFFDFDRHSTDQGNNFVNGRY